jgi:hypothetical protein
VEVCEKLLQSRVRTMFQDEEFHAFPRLRTGDARRKSEGLWAVVDFRGNRGRMHHAWCRSGGGKDCRADRGIARPLGRGESMKCGRL